MTLLEALIGLAVLGVLMGLALPAFQEWTRNAQIRNAADAMANGLQFARAEAISRNGLVQFRFVSTTSSWQVWDVPSDSQIRAWSPQQGALNTTVTATGGDTVTFNGVGRVVPNPATPGPPPPTLTQLDITATSGATSATRALRVTIGVAGSARMCDPAVSIVGDPRAC